MRHRGRTVPLPGIGLWRFHPQTVLGMLACTGFRAGEALALDLVDVFLDVESAHLCTREAKFHKTRQVR